MKAMFHPFKVNFWGEEGFSFTELPWWVLRFGFHEEGFIHLESGPTFIGLCTVFFDSGGSRLVTEYFQPFHKHGDEHEKCPYYKGTSGGGTHGTSILGQRTRKKTLDLLSAVQPNLHVHIVTLASTSWLVPVTWRFFSEKSCSCLAAPVFTNSVFALTLHWSDNPIGLGKWLD